MKFRIWNNRYFDVDGGKRRSYKNLDQSFNVGKWTVYTPEGRTFFEETHADAIKRVGIIMAGVIK